MKIFRTTVFLICVALFSSASPSYAYEEISLDKVMTELKSENSDLYKKATKVYKYASLNTKEIIEKPLLTKHNKALNGFVDRDNKVSAKFYASGSEGIAARMVMLFKFSDKKYKVVEDYTRSEKCKKWAACAPWKKVE